MAGLDKQMAEVARGYLAGISPGDVQWQAVGYALEESQVAPSRIAALMSYACLHHPLARRAPREAVQGRNVLRWLEELYKERGWTLPRTPLHEFPDEEPLALSYKTYVGWGDRVTRGGGPGGDEGGEGDSSEREKENNITNGELEGLLSSELDEHWRGSQGKGVTILESRGGITHNTTGLTTWSGAAVLAEWASCNASLLAGRRVLELGSGCGFGASVFLTSPTKGHAPPASYIATDCNHHVLSVLRHNLHLNLAPTLPSVDELESFQRASVERLDTDVCESMEVKPWTPPPPLLYPDVAMVGGDRCGGTQVGVMQLDWCNPRPLPPVDIIIASDVVYAHCLIPPLIKLIRSILTSGSSTTESHDPIPKEAYIACTRRTQETMDVFLEELESQGLKHEVVYQETVGREHNVFAYNECHRPVKVFKISMADS